MNFVVSTEPVAVWLAWSHDDVIKWKHFPRKGAVTCAVCPESAWLVTFLIRNVSTGVVTWSALRCGASGESGKKVTAAPLSKTAAAAAAAKTWFAKHPVDYMLHNRFPWKRSGRRSSMWPPYSLRRNLSAAACRPCDRSFTGPLHGEFTALMFSLIYVWTNGSRGDCPFVAPRSTDMTVGAQGPFSLWTIFVN